MITAEVACQQAINANRRKAVEFLRTTKRRQTTGILYHEPTGAVCALGAIGVAVGIDITNQAYSRYAAIRAAVDMTYHLEGEIECMNDIAVRGFAEIGDMLAAHWGIE